MSFSRKNNLWGGAKSLLSRIVRKDSGRSHAQKMKKLFIDQLEERQMLSLTVATPGNLLVNTSWQDIRGDVAVDSNEAGDVVVAWTAADRLANPDYDASDPNSSMYLTDAQGNYIEDLNVYARYLTDEVQIITIPEEIVPGATLDGGGKTQSGSFELIYNAHETQRLSIFTSNFTQDGTDVYTTSNSQAVFYLGLYAEGELTWILYRYDSELLPGANAANLQEAIRAIPGQEYKDVVVSAYSETDFDITFFGDNWAGYDLTEVRVSNDYYSDVTALIDKVSNISFDVTELEGVSPFQKLVLTDLFGKNYVSTISSMINTQGRKSVVKTLQTARDSLTDNLTSGVVSAVDEVLSITNYNSKGQKTGIVVDSDPFKTAQNIQKAFDQSSGAATLYAPITRGYEYNEKTHRFEYTNVPTKAYSTDESYGSMQAPIPDLDVRVEPVPGTTNQFRITFTGASGLVNQDSLFVSAATYSTKVSTSYVYTDVVTQNSITGVYEYVGTGDYDVNAATITVKESSEVFRVNAPEVADFVRDGDGNVMTDRYGEPYINGTGRTDQSKPDVALSSDGSFVIVWQNENPDVLDTYNKTDIHARRFRAQGYIPTSPSEGGYNSNYSIDFYNNGTTDGNLGLATPDGFVSDPYSLNGSSSTAIAVQCVAPVADEFIVNASRNGQQIDPSISSDVDGGFIVTWTYIAQDNSYFGGVYGRQFNNEAESLTGDITFASSQVSSNYYGPSYTAMSDEGFAVVMWNYGPDLYMSALEPGSDVFIFDGVQIANNAYGSSVDFDYNERFAITYTQETPSDSSGTTNLPQTDVYVSIYAITEVPGAEDENAFDYTPGTIVGEDDEGNADDENGGMGLYVGTRKTSVRYQGASILDPTLVNSITVADQGNPGVGVDADGDVFIAYQGFGMDIHSVPDSYLSNPALMYSTNPDDFYIQLEWSDFEDNNLVYENKQFLRGKKYTYESKNEDLIYYIKLALGWGYDQYGDFTNDNVTPIYQIHNYDCIDVDSYIKFFQTVAQKEHATDEQLMRLNAVLETLLSPLRNNGNDVNYVNYGQTVYGDSIATPGGDDEGGPAIITDASVISGVVSDYRNGSNACFYVALPAEYIASASIALSIGRLTDTDQYETNAQNAENVTLDLTPYYNTTYGYLNDPRGMVEGVQNALNSLAICDGDTNSFVVRMVPMTEIEFYEGTYGEIGLTVDDFQYVYEYTEDNTTYYGTRTVGNYVALQITAQNSLHDTPLYITYDVDDSSMKLVDQANDDMDFALYQSFYVERYGSMGCFQTNANASITSNGDVVVVWAMKNQSSATQRSDVYPTIGNSLDTAFTHVYMRPFTESTDTAGPIVTNLSMPDGTKVDDGATLTSAVKDMVVSFDENMITIGDGTSQYNRIHAVDNPANWTLLKDGVEITGAIESVVFGMNASAQLARDAVTETGDAVDSINNGVLASGTNRWEAVVHFADGYELVDGNYTLVCSALVQDTSRNGLYSQGYAPDGSAQGYDGHDWSCAFNVVPLNEALAFDYGETFRYGAFIPVSPIHGADSAGDPIENAEATGETIRQTTRSSILDETSDYGPNTANSVACNANGDSVVVWVEAEGSVESGTVIKTVYARTYRALYIVNADGVREQVIDMESATGDPIVVYQTTNKYDAKGNLKSGTDPRQASVAMDDSGDFCVVWDMLTTGSGEDGSRDVYMAKYAFNGGQMAINGDATRPTRANVETDYDQQYPAVAMDSDGDIVVVWESYKQDGSGWGIFGRRFMTNGLSYGYANTIQTIQIIDPINVEGDSMTIAGTVGSRSFRETIPLSVEMKVNATRIKDALVSAGFQEDEVVVALTSSGTISVEFQGQYTAQYVDQFECTTNRNDLRVSVAMRQVGSEGTEFPVNQTTENNQRFASIGMEPDGSFVVSWTSWGQDLDSPTESNIYARKFASNHVISSNVTSVEAQTPASTTGKVITTDPISMNQVYPGQGYDSVCYITVGDTGTDQGGTGGAGGGTGETISSGTGSLLTDRYHILTAAHVVTDDNGVPIDLTDTPIYCTFETTAGVYTIPVAEITVHPTYAGDPAGNQVDLALLTLSVAAPSVLHGYDLYTGSSELGQRFTFVGYGLAGDVGETDAEIAARAAGTKHSGNNVYELTGATFAEAGNPNTLVYDFDDGTYANDYLGNYYGVRNLGLGRDEAITAPGDSGGPSFINGQIAGVCSFGSDFTGDGSFGPGNYQVDVRVSAYVDWINSVILGGLGDEFLVNTDQAVSVNAAVGGADDDEATIITSDFWQKGNQIWSSVSCGTDGSFVITWTGYNQDGNGDAQTGSSNYGLGGVFMRAFISDEMVAADPDGGAADPDDVLLSGILGSKVFQVNQYTANDQIHSQVAMSTNGSFVVTYESFQDPSSDVNSDLADNYGIFARRYSLDKTTTTITTPGDDTNAPDVTITTSYDILEEGEEFRVTKLNYLNAEDDGDQLGGAVAVDANGDMIFVWSDLSHPMDNIESVVCMRSIALPDDTTPPYVTRSNAVYTEADGTVNQVSLYSNHVTFASGNGPTSLVYAFSEYMFTAQMNEDVKSDVFVPGEMYDGIYRYSDNRNLENKNVKSVINWNDWTLTLNGKDVTSTYVYDIIYGYNASTKVEDYLRQQGLTPEEIAEMGYTTVADDAYRTNTYELVILFKETLPDGTYVMTLSDKVTDASGKNRLDGDYDGESGGSFSVTFNVGAGMTTDDEYVPETDTPAFEGVYGGEGKPIVVSNSDGFIIVTEQQVLYELGAGTGGGTGGGGGGTGNENQVGYDAVHGYYETVVIDDTLYRIESDIVMHQYNADGSSAGSDVRVNPYAEGNQIHPDIALTESGSFVVAWIGESSEALNGVCARFYPGGQAQKEQVQVAGTKGMRCWDVDVSINETTGLVLITWVQGSKDGDTQADEMYGRFYDLNGNAKGSAFKIQSQISGYSVQEFDVETIYVDGKARYICVWEMYNVKTRTYDVYQKVIEARNYSGSYYAVATEQATLVNQTTVYGQWAPAITTNQDTGEFYIVWVSDQIQENGADIYCRRFDKYGNPMSFMGTTDEVLVNNYRKNVQGAPDVACNNDGVVIVWESYDAEEYNYSSDPNDKTDLHDYGVACRVFDYEGYPIYIMGTVYETIDTGLEEIEVAVEKTPGERLKLDEGEFVINSITQGDQFAPSVDVFDWTHNAATGLKVPRFVVAWAGPNKDAATEIEDDTTDGGQGGNQGGGQDGTANAATSYLGPYRVFFKYVTTGVSASNDSTVTISGKGYVTAKGDSYRTSTVSGSSIRYATDESTTTSNGFYRPIGTAVEQPVANGDSTSSDSSVYRLAGTDGDDLFVISVDVRGKLKITLNGQNVSIPSSATTIFVDGGDGDDRIVYTSKAGNDVDVSADKLTFSAAQTLVATGFESVDASGKLGALNVNAKSKAESVELSPENATFTANGLVFTAKGFKSVSASGAGKASLVMTGSAGDDTLVVDGSSVLYAGAGFDFAANNFAIIRAMAGDGVDSAKINGVKTLNATDGAIVAETANGKFVAVGFENASVAAQDAAKASLFGTKGDDSYVANSDGATTTFSSGSTLKTTGFAETTFDGRGGEDTAELNAVAGANTFEGWANKAVMKSPSSTTTLNGFDSVQVKGAGSGLKSSLAATLHNTARDNAFAAFGDSFEMDVDGANLYSIVAADLVNVKRDYNSSNEFDVADDLDFDLSADWDI
ncbi:MAG: hypothetical protein ACOX0A_08925 [Thermoguttaceae bacterium]|jgi:hypothetical protein